MQVSSIFYTVIIARVEERLRQRVIDDAKIRGISMGEIAIFYAIRIGFNFDRVFALIFDGGNDAVIRARV